MLEFSEKHYKKEHGIKEEPKTYEPIPESEIQENYTERTDENQAEKSKTLVEPPFVENENQISDPAVFPDKPVDEDAFEKKKSVLNEIPVERSFIASPIPILAN